MENVDGARLNVNNFFTGDLPCLDVVAVHGIEGLNKDARECWTSEPAEYQEECSWLLDILPREITGVRVMSFTYGNDTDNGAHAFTAEGVRKNARDLLDCLRSERQDEKYAKIPIVFLAHDFGGIIVKKALVTAAFNPKYASIAQLSPRIVFFSTPHRASQRSSWEDLIFNIILSLPSTRFLENIATRLRTFSRVLEELSQDFNATRLNLRCINVYQNPRGTADSINVVINKYSATTGLVDEVNIGRSSTHENICRFSKIGPELIVILEAFKTETDADHSACLSILSTISPTFNVSDNLYPVTDLLGADYQEEMNTWITSSSSCCFRTFGETADISPIAASLFHHLRNMPLLATYVSFRSHDRRRSPLITILASLISQMLIQEPSKFNRVKHLVASILRTGSWAEAGLLNLFKQVLCAESHRKELVVVVDFHEWTSSRGDIFDAILVLFKLDLPPSRLKIALFGHLHDNHQRTLDEFGEHHVESPKIFRSVAEFSVENFLRCKPELLPLKSEVVDAFARCESASTLTVTMHYLREVTGAPWSLNSLRDSIKAFRPCIADFISSRPTSIPQWAVEAVGWVLLAKRPLRTSELVTAVKASKTSRGTCSTVDVAEVPFDVEAGLQSLFGPLLRIERGHILISQDDFREALEKDLAERSNSVLPHANSANQGSLDCAPHAAIPDHGTISATLIQYLTSLVEKERLNNTSENSHWTENVLGLDLVKYASEFWSSHYLEAKQMGLDVDINIMVPEDHNTVHSLSELLVKLDPTSIPRGLHVDTLSLLAVQMGIASTVENMGSTLEGPHYGAAIELASWIGHAKVVSSLLSDAERSSGLDLRDALRYASARGHDGIVKQLLDHLSSSGEKLALTKVAGSLICQAAQLGFKTQVSWFAEREGNVSDALQHAAKNGHLSVVKFLLDDGPVKPDVNWTSEELNDTPMMLAVSGGHQMIIKRLLDSSADMWTRTSGRSTMLHVAASQGYDDVLELLLPHFANLQGPQPLEATATLGARDSDANSTAPRIIDMADYVGRTALIIACQAKHERSANMLLEHGADVTLKDEDSHTALHYAICANKHNLAKAILSRRSSIHVFTDIDEVFYQACASGFTELVTQCIEAYADRGFDEVYQFRPSDSKRTPLHAAAASGHRGVVALLLSQDVEVDSTDSEDKTPLGLAATSGHVDIVKCLIDAGAEASHRDSTILRDLAGVSHTSARHSEIISMLLEKGADPNDEDDDGQTSLHIAVFAGNIEAVRLLVQYKADPSRQDTQATTALHLAATRRGRNSANIARILINAGSSIYETDNEGWTPAHIAAMWANIDVLQYLWSCDHEVLNRTSHNGRTALHFAFDEPMSIEWLLDHKARVDAADNAGETTLMIAASHGMIRSVELLLDHLANTKITDCNLRTALHCVASSSGVSNQECARKLVQSNPSLLECRDANKHSPLSLAISSGNTELADFLLKEFYPSMDTTRLSEHLDDPDAEGNTALLWAIKKRELDVARQLMVLGANPNIRNNKRENALLIAIKEARGLEDLETMIGTLVDDITKAATLNAAGGLDASALHVAAQLDEAEFVEFLIKLGADVNCEGGPYNTALVAAAADGCEDVIRLLLQKGADRRKSGGLFPNAYSAALSSRVSEDLLEQLKVGIRAETKDNQGRTAMHIAARLEPWSTIRELRTLELKNLGLENPELGTLELETLHNMCLFAKDLQGRTLLHHAAMSGCLDFFVNLKASHGDIFEEINIKDRDGWTPLHWACRYDGGKEILGFLKSLGASLLEATNDGWTPESIAVFHDADDIVDWLAENRTDQEQQQEQKRWQVGSASWAFSCDGCGLRPLYGTRWRCEDCGNYDFCFKCHWSANETHPGHRFSKDGPGEERRPMTEDRLEPDGSESGAQDESSSQAFSDA